MDDRLNGRKNATYPFRRSKVRQFNGVKGQTEIIMENLCQSKIPTRFILGMINNWQKKSFEFSAL